MDHVTLMSLTLTPIPSLSHFPGKPSLTLRAPQPPLSRSPSTTSLPHLLDKGLLMCDLNRKVAELPCQLKETANLLL